jgi:hypothetical protein
MRRSYHPQNHNTVLADTRHLPKKKKKKKKKKKRGSKKL